MSQVTISAREADVLAALAEHRSNAQIARSLHISVRTVESHVSSLLRQYGVSDRRELAEPNSPNSTYRCHTQPIPERIPEAGRRSCERPRVVTTNAPPTGTEESMPDYGHDLSFGSFVTPAHANAQDVVAAAQAAERAGLDLVTFQDHPYQPRFLDTWTLMSYVAARTQKVRLAGNVLNLPLRPPAVLARSVASLDQLSGGRVELGLGAGAFWDAIEAMGGRRLSPGQAVDALTESIDVIRGVWDVTNPERFRVSGSYYQVDGAKRGPAPAHPVEIWLGAYKPRMLRLTGRKADGWLPSIGRMSTPEIARANETIDDAAAEAGRSPRMIRRLANVPGQFGPPSGRLLSGPVEQWVDQLASLALEHGFSTFILAGDDVSAYDRIGQEVIPAVREAVAAER